MAMPGLVVVVTVHGASDLHAGFVESLAAVAADLVVLNGKIVIINDAPGDEELETALSTCSSRLTERCTVEVIVTSERAGPVAARNRGLAAARQNSSDATLLDANTLLSPGVLIEMQLVAYSDPLIGFVSPRSNNSPIGGSLTRSLLPRTSYVPIADGSCLFIKTAMLVEFGLYDEAFTTSRDADIDFMMRCNRRGYRAVLANHSFVQQFTDSAPPASDVLLQRYPEYARSLRRYRSSAAFRAEQLISGLIPSATGKSRMLFECSQLGSFHNGTFEVAVATMTAFAEQFSGEFECYVSGDRSAFEFHGLPRVRELRYLGDVEAARAEAPFAAAIRLAQPFSLEDIVNLGVLAPITGFLMLDTIALDCQNLDEGDLAVVWEQMLHTTSLIGYISQFSGDQFRRRFLVPAGVTEITALLSTDPGEYVEKARDAKDGDYVLLIGNHYSHKHLHETVRLYMAQPARPPLVVFGIALTDESGLTSYGSGQLDDDTVSRLYDGAKAILFPSHYEGFGLPIMRALAHRKPVIARRLPVFEETRQRAPGGANIHLFDTTVEMVRFAAAGPAWVDVAKTPAQVQTWHGTARAVRDALTEAWGRLCFRALYERLLAVAACENMLAQRAAAALSEERAALSEERAALTERQLVAVLESRSWRITQPLRFVSHHGQYARRGTVAWLRCAPGSRPHRMSLALLKSAGEWVLRRPTLAAGAKRLLEPFPDFRQRLGAAVGSPRSLGPASPPFSPLAASPVVDPSANLSPEGQRIYRTLRRRLEDWATR